MKYYRSFSAGTLLLGLLTAVPAHAQLGGIGQALGRAQQARQDFVFTDAEERQLGSDISTRLRNRYGVVQNRAVHQYVALVGTMLAQASTRPGLRWTFVVLDTDGVNAFAAPGGFVHVTRGALALIRNESELAAVLGHEIGHIVEKHTLEAIQKSKGIEVVAQSSRNEFLAGITERAYAAILENSFDRGDETEADRVGVTLANRSGYAPQGLGSFLRNLDERNKGLTERSGMFASHPEAQARLDALTRTISAGKLTATATVAPRYTTTITYRPIPVAAVASSASSSGGRLGLANNAALGRERSSNETVSSAGSRGVNPDRDAPGGPVKTLVSITVSAAEIAAFKKGITG